MSRNPKEDPVGEGSTLEPQDWDAFRAAAHRALDVALDYAQSRPRQAVWQPVPDAIKASDQPLPMEGESLSEVVEAVRSDILPYTLGNNHPRFWGWVNGSGTPSGIVSQAFVGAINANMGGREHAPIYIERQVVKWMQQLLGYPATASGLICTGTSYATLLALSVARQHALGQGVRAAGNGNHKLVAYCSEQAHVSVSKAMEVLGLGSDALRSVPVSEDFTLDDVALNAAIEADRAAGYQPFAVISVVGAVNTGAVDDLVALGKVCREQGIWHHVDGAFGAMAALAPRLKPKLAGIEQADSIAFDFHKWMHVTYSAACLLVRDGDLHLNTFATSHAYLRGERRGAAAGAPWPCEYGVDLSRGFSALGVWMLLKEVGANRLGEAIDRNCRQAEWLAARIDQTDGLERLTPVALNIVCFRFLAPQLSDQQLDGLNRQIVVALHCEGIAVPSFTEIAGKTAIRVCIANHRTQQSDLQALVDSVLTLGAQLLASADEDDDFALSAVNT